MPSLFPYLLNFQFFAPTIERVVAGLVFLYIAYQMVQMRDEICRARVILVGHIKEWMVWLAVFVDVCVGIFLVAGLWTQGAAIVGMLICIKHALGLRSYRAILPLSGAAYILLFVICFCLLFAGAGAIGFDLPL